ncbi:MAG: hypothetical protein JWM28_4095 [Chitinophagaceae bacterium]|nr:hypothetical protein [Chitinophagaceae bacterium]
MKKVMLIGSFLITLTGIWMSSCEPSRKGGGSPGTTDSLSVNNGAPNGAMDSTLHGDTTHQKR